MEQGYQELRDKMTLGLGKPVSDPESWLLHIYGFNCQQKIGYVRSKGRTYWNNHTA